jgi:O-antigen ligase
LSEVAQSGVVTAYGVNPLEEVAAKNAFSLYAIPAVFLALGIFILPKSRLWQRVVFALCSAVILVVVFGSANRSGWVTMIMVPLVLLVGRVKLRVIALTVVMSLVVWVAAERLHLTKVFVDRFALTQEGYSSDDLRMEIYWLGLLIFLENPVVGALPWNVNFELARRAFVPFPQLGTHSIVVLMVAGFGLLGTIPFVLMATEYLRVGGVDARAGLKALVRRPSSHLMAGLAFLWLVRGLFTDEVLWAPCFAIGFGLVLSLALIERRAAGQLVPMNAVGAARPGTLWRAPVARGPRTGGRGASGGVVGPAGSRFAAHAGTSPLATQRATTPTRGQQ